MAMLCVRPLEVDDLTVAELIAIVQFKRLLNNAQLWQRIHAVCGDGFAEVARAQQEVHAWARDHEAALSPVAHMSRAAVADIHSYAAHS